MPRARRHEYRIVALYARALSVDQDLPASFLDPKKLVNIIVQLFADVLPRLQSGALGLARWVRSMFVFPVASPFRLRVSHHSSTVPRFQFPPRSQPLRRGPPQDDDLLTQNQVLGFK